MKAKTKFDIKTEEEICNLYTEKISSIKLGKMFNCCPTVILQILRKHLVHIRNNIENKTKYSFNHDYFKEINNENKAYWLGYILADGCVSHKELILGGALKDIEIANKFIKDIESNNSVKIYKKYVFNKWYEAFRISFRSDSFLKDLNNLGITSRKTDTIRVPLIDSDLLRHFWRGVLDGDGWVSISNYARKHKNKTYFGLSLEVGICGNEFVMKSFSNYLSSLGIENKITPDKSIWRVRVCNDRALKICEELYEGSTISLARKNQNYLKYLDYRKKKEEEKLSV